MVMKPGGRSLRFTAVEEFAVERVAFAWRARFPVLGTVALRVTDSYEPPDGGLDVRLFKIPVQRQRGPEVIRGEAFRYLAELAWVPQAIVANPELAWRVVDDDTVQVSTEVGGERVAVELQLSGDEIVRTVAERPRVEAGGALTRWVGEFGDYTSFGGIRMPAHGEVRWELPEGPFTYWRGTITDARISGGRGSAARGG
jgi:Family of unknown function (DUF6544)